MKSILSLIVLLVGTALAAGAQKQITLEEIWKTYAFTAKSVPGFTFQKDGKHYTRLEKGKIQQHNLVTGSLTATLLDAAALAGQSGFNGEVDGYSFSADEQKILLWSEEEPLYRHSTKAFYYVYSVEDKSIKPVMREGKVSLATFNGQADKVAFVFMNNLMYHDLKTGLVRQATTDGLQNNIINGATDWVYEEEFSFSKAFEWSPDGQKIAFYRFDERQVPEFTMTNYNDDLYPEYVTFKYPKVGAKNSDVTLHIFDTGTGSKIDVASTLSEDHYIPRIKWTNDPGKLCVFRMNRHQNQLELLLADAQSGKTTLLLKEENKHYIDIHDDLTFLKDGKRFIWTSERDGWNHLYLYDMSGKQLEQLTQGQWEVTKFYGIDEAREQIYYQATEKSPMERQVYAQSLKGKRKQKLASDAGWNEAQFSSNYDYYVVTHSTINKPATYTVYNNDAKIVREIEANAGLRKIQQTYQTGNIEFFNFKTSEQVALNGWLLKPANFNPAVKYPVLMHVYGGPGSQQVKDAWMGQNYWWFQMLAQQGFVVACVDNRGTGGRGEAFKKMTYLQLGKYETIDQIEAAKYLAKQSYVDKSRIGIFGWSYGGYMSSLALLKGNDVFKAAIAVAPVTNWKWYDSIYTERYMRTEQENTDGYKDNSPVYFADRLKGDYLLIHGMGDDNVHFQHAAEMARALIGANKQFDTYFYPNRNHGIYGGLTRLHLYTKMTSFLMDKLKAPQVGKRLEQGIKITPLDGAEKE